MHDVSTVCVHYNVHTVMPLGPVKTIAENSLVLIPPSGNEFATELRTHPPLSRSPVLQHHVGREYSKSHLPDHSHLQLLANWLPAVSKTSDIDEFQGAFYHGNWRALYHHAAC